MRWKNDRPAGERPPELPQGAARGADFALTYARACNIIDLVRGIL